MTSLPRAIPSRKSPEQLLTASPSSSSGPDLVAYTAHNNHYLSPEAPNKSENPIYGYRLNNPIPDFVTVFKPVSPSLIGTDPSLIVATSAEEILAQLKSMFPTNNPHLSRVLHAADVTNTQHISSLTVAQKTKTSAAAKLTGAASPSSTEYATLPLFWCFETPVITANDPLTIQELVLKHGTLPLLNTPPGLCPKDSPFYILAQRLQGTCLLRIGHSKARKNARTTLSTRTHINRLNRCEFPYPLYAALAQLFNKTGFKRREYPTSLYPKHRFPHIQVHHLNNPNRALDNLTNLSCALSQLKPLDIRYNRRHNPHILTRIARILVTIYPYLTPHLRSKSKLRALHPGYGTPGPEYLRAVAASRVAQFLRTYNHNALPKKLPCLIDPDTSHLVGTPSTKALTDLSTSSMAYELPTPEALVIKRT